MASPIPARPHEPPRLSHLPSTPPHRHLHPRRMHARFGRDRGRSLPDARPHQRGRGRRGGRPVQGRLRVPARADGRSERSHDGLQPGHAPARPRGPGERPARAHRRQGNRTDAQGELAMAGHERPHLRARPGAAARDDLRGHHPRGYEGARRRRARGRVYLQLLDAEAGRRARERRARPVARPPDVDVRRRARSAGGPARNRARAAHRARRREDRPVPRCVPGRREQEARPGDTQRAAPPRDPPRLPVRRRSPRHRGPAHHGRGQDRGHGHLRAAPRPPGGLLARLSLGQLLPRQQREPRALQHGHGERPPRPRAHRAAAQDAMDEEHRGRPGHLAQRAGDVAGRAFVPGGGHRGAQGPLRPDALARRDVSADRRRLRAQRADRRGGRDLRRRARAPPRRPHLLGQLGLRPRDGHARRERPHEPPRRAAREPPARRRHVQSRWRPRRREERTGAGGRGAEHARGQDALPRRARRPQGTGRRVRRHPLQRAVGRGQRDAGALAHRPRHHREDEPLREPRLGDAPERREPRLRRNRRRAKPRRRGLLRADRRQRDGEHPRGQVRPREQGRRSRRAQRDHRAVGRRLGVPPRGRRGQPLALRRQRRHVRHARAGRDGLHRSRRLPARRDGAREGHLPQGHAEGDGHAERRGCVLGGRRRQRQRVLQASEEARRLRRARRRRPAARDRAPRLRGAPGDSGQEGRRRQRTGGAGVVPARLVPRRGVQGHGRSRQGLLHPRGQGLLRGARRLPLRRADEQDAAPLQRDPRPRGASRHRRPRG